MIGEIAIPARSAGIEISPIGFRTAANDVQYITSTIIMSKPGIAAAADIEIIARGVLIGPRGVMLCRPSSGGYAYLPGGHVEFGETAGAALEREILEELGMKARAERYLGAIESSFVQGQGTSERRHHEINLVFQLSSSVIARRARLEAAEEGIEFFWNPTHNLGEVNLLPKPLRLLIPRWSIGKIEPWASDMARM